MQLLLLCRASPVRLAVPVHHGLGGLAAPGAPTPTRSLRGYRGRGGEGATQDPASACTWREAVVGRGAACTQQGTGRWRFMVLTIAQGC